MEERFILRKAVLGEVATNVYFLKNTQSGELLIVDPAEGAETILRKIREMEGKPAGILLTHGHFDHILSVQKLLEAYPVPVYAARAEREMLLDPEKNMTAQYSFSQVSFDADHYLDDLEIFECAGFRIQVICTPGHTVGSCCYYLKEERLLFSGDTLFCGSVGRTDFPGGSMREMVSSLHRLLDTLPEETVVYPGHDISTTIGEEKRYNPFV